MRLTDADALAVAVTTAEFLHDADRSKTWWLIYKSPTIEAEPVRHGQWLVDARTGMSFCSDCNCYAVEADTKYCPECGCKMDLEE